MDLFEALVRLDAAGWKTLPARPELAAVLPAELARLVKRAGGLQLGDRRFDFTGTDPLPNWMHVHGAFARRVSESVVLVGAGDHLAVFEITNDPRRLTYLAPDIGSWLAQELAPAPATSTPPDPLADLAFDGEGWGWDREQLVAPTRLSLDQLPTDLLDEPVHLDARCIWIGDRLVDVAPASPAVVEEALAAPAPNLDELFGAGGGRPRPRATLIAMLVATGIVLAVLGMGCISVPGGLLVLLAWMLVEKDLDRLESGYLPEADREVVMRVRSLTYAGLLLVVVLFVLQGLLLCNGFYDVLLDNVYIPWWRSLFVGEGEPALSAF